MHFGVGWARNLGREDRFLDGPASREQGSKGRNELYCIRDKGRDLGREAVEPMLPILRVRLVFGVGGSGCGD